MNSEYIEIIRNERSGTIFLNRPQVRNALNPSMISGLIAAIKRLDNDPEMKVIVIRGKGGTFCSGADLQWLRESGSKTFEQNLSENELIFNLMNTLSQIRVPLLSFVEGSAIGGALGILGCSDWVFADANTRMAFSEVKLGLAPAIIMPYVMRRSGSIRIKQLMLTGKAFDAWEALDNGLVDRVGESKEMQAELDKLVQIFVELPGMAVREIKRLWDISKTHPVSDVSLMAITSLANLKQTPEAQELLTNFLKRKA
jgi:methylglutaconyl-CoA hydratase